MPNDFVSGCRAAFSQTIWLYEEDGSSAGKDAQMFREFGLDHLLSARTLFPPSKTCTTPGCMNTKLLREKDGISKVVLFTLSDRAVPYKLLWCLSLSHRYICTAAKLAAENFWPERLKLNHFGPPIEGTMMHLARAARRKTVN
ncbi:hypothetical protein B0H14DRAFT_3555524 [Mycena olivaceomarginata]|nr:hypothetical protein B0H14DRAFT_3555524 [Mycena olivaceomarginata]